MSEHERDQRPEDQPGAAEPGSGIGRESDPARPLRSQPPRAAQLGDVPPDDPAELPPDQPDEGWREWPGGHRQGRAADDDLQRRKG